MRRTIPLILLPVLLGQAPDAAKDAADEKAARAKRERLIEIYRGEASGYTIYRDSGRKEPVELRREPVYVWTNQVRTRGQDGAVFVWTCRGRAEVVGSFASFPPTGRRNLSHEFHSLATTTLDVTHPGPHTWRPEAPGIELATVPGAPSPARSPAQRLAQMRGLTRDFSANS